MAAPDYVPMTLADKPRRSLPLPAARPWTAARPGDLPGRQPGGSRLGSQGPDQGYALALAERFHGRLHLAPGEHHHDVEAGVVAVAMKRASLFGRAPVIHDLDLAFGLFGFLDPTSGVPVDLREWRLAQFSGAGHHYWKQRAIADGVPEATLRMAPAAARAGLASWRSMMSA